MVAPVPSALLYCVSKCKSGPLVSKPLQGRAGARVLIMHVICIASALCLVMQSAQHWPQYRLGTGTGAVARR